MTIFNKHQELMSRWQASTASESDRFAEDGIVDRDAWINSKTKVLFVLKETNNYPESGHGNIADLIHRHIDKPDSGLWKRPTFHNIGRWAYGLTHYHRESAQPIPDYADAHRHRKKALNQIAYINLKKTPGTRQSDQSIDRHACTYGSLIREQIELINPDIVVLGGTYWPVKQHVYPELERVANRIHTLGQRVFINTYHPACIKKRLDIYLQALKSYDDYMRSKDSHS